MESPTTVVVYERLQLQAAACVGYHRRRDFGKLPHSKEETIETLESIETIRTNKGERFCFSRDGIVVFTCAENLR